VKQLLVATSNHGKFSEFSEMLSGHVDKLFSLCDFPELKLPAETGETFEENALIKARHAANATGIPTIADDSGLEVDSLQGAPGVHSARYAGERSVDSANNSKLLKELENVDQDRRGARFSCCIAFCQPDGGCRTFFGQLQGRIINEPRGNNGFGYDPLFLIPEYDKTLAELDMQIKNSISHRSNALRQLINDLD